MPISTGKKLALFLLFVIFTIAFAILGQYVGAALYFNLTSISLDYIEFLSLYNNWNEYNLDLDIKPYLQLGIGAAVLTTLFPILMVVMIMIAIKKKEEIHGSAGFATDMDLAKSGLFNPAKKSPSILLGKMNTGRFKGQYVQLEGQTFAGVEAPTGAGKGVAIVIPNLVNYSDSVVCNDIKLENFEKTAGFRKSAGQQVFLFAPDGYAISEEDRDKGILRTHRWNPFFYIRRRDAYRIGDILTMSNSIYPLTGDAKADIWPSSSGKLFLGLTLWMLDTEDKTKMTPTFPYLLSLIGVEGGLVKWIESEISLGYLSEDCTRELSTFLSYPDETRGSILANFNAPLGIYSDKTAANAVSDNDFDFRDLRRKGISVYVGVQPPNKKRFQGLLNLFFEQLINENTRVIPEIDESLTHQCLLLLDEFPALGKVSQIKESIGFTRQYNLRYLFIYQDKSQLEDRELYGKEGADNILSNLATEVIYPPKKVTQRVKEICETLGTKTVAVESESTTRGKNFSRGKSKSKQKRQILMPHELVELGHIRHPTADIGLKTLLFKENQRSFIMDKIIYFEEEVMSKRVQYSKDNVPEIPLLK